MGISAGEVRKLFIKPAIKSNMLKFCKTLICKEKLQLPVMQIIAGLIRSPLG